MIKDIAVDLPIYLRWGRKEDQWIKSRTPNSWIRRWHNSQGRDVERMTTRFILSDYALPNRRIYDLLYGMGTRAAQPGDNGPYRNIWYVRDLNELLHLANFAGVNKEEMFVAIGQQMVPEIEDFAELNLLLSMTKYKYHDIMRILLEQPDFYRAEVKRYKKADGQDVF